MNKRTATFGLPITLIVLLLTLSCAGDKKTDSPFVMKDEVVVGTRAADDAKVLVDVYLDATTSMEGYARNGSTYGQFLDALDRSITVGWPAAQVQFYRFGSRVDSISRDVFRTARTDPAFYRIPGLFERTSIDSVLARADLDRVSVVVTDLFQSGGDVNRLIDQIKDGAFTRGLDVALLAVPSEFDGRVYDAPGGAYALKSTPEDSSTLRPFYALMFGRPGNIKRLFETMRAHRFVSPRRFLVISPYLVDEYHVAMKPHEINAAAPGPNPNQFAFNLRPRSEGGTFATTVVLVPNGFAPRIAPERVTLTAYRRTLTANKWSTDSTLVQDFSLSNMTWKGDTLQATLTFRLSEPKGSYAYHLLFRTGQIAGLDAPKWVSALSSTAPSESVDASKTLNLTSFVDGLIQAHSTLRQPVLAQALLIIRKP